MKTTFENIDHYISLQAKEIKPILEDLREKIQTQVHSATEVISYGMPAFKYNGKILVYFAAWKNHIGFYPTGKTIHELAHLLTNFTFSKGAIQFPLTKKLPTKLIKAILIHRINSINHKIK